MTAMIRILLGCALLVSCAKASGEQPDGPPVVAADAAAVDASELPDAPPTPDAPNGCATQPCDILAQCGCAGAACDIDGSDNAGTACRAITTPGHETSTCTSPGRCDAGFVCLVGNNIGTCRKYCDADADCGTPRGKCVVDVNDGTGNPLAGIPTTCSSNCDPTNVALGGCPATMKCGLFTTTHLGVVQNIAQCSPATATGTQGVNCRVGTAGDDTLCAPDFLCTTVTAGTNNCRRICNKTLNTGCGALTCIGFTTPLTLGGTEYGVCN
jgi:hypothetical protein